MVGTLRDGCVRALPNSVVTVLARERGFASGGRMVEIERLEFVGPWRRDRKVAVGPAVGRRQHLIEKCLALPIDRHVAPDFGGGLAKIARIEKQGILSRQANPAIAPAF